MGDERRESNDPWVRKAEPDPHTVVLGVVGDVGERTPGRLERAVESAARGGKLVVVDLRESGGLDRAAADRLVFMRAEARAHGCRFAVLAGERVAAELRELELERVLKPARDLAELREGR